MTTWVCGTGTGNFPKPGDPDNNVILTATPAFGGIDVQWSYPMINPQAVAHVHLYRSTSPEEWTAVRYHTVTGTYFFDRIEIAGTMEYHYWIQIVSVNGTIGEMIGPATATSRPTIAAMLELLTGQIDAGLLAQSLKNEIAQIETNRLGITAEMLARAASDDALGVAYNEVRAQSDETRALLQNEVLARTSANEALVTAVNTLHSTVQNGEQAWTAAIQQESVARASADATLASQITTAQSQMAENIASVQTNLETEITTLGDRVTSVGARYTALVTVNDLIGGFGIANDGTQVEAGFDVDRFWIGRTAANKRKPFIVQNDEVFIDSAVIQNAAITAAKIADAAITAAHIQDASISMAKISEAIQSDNYVPQVSGWKLTRSGEFEINGSIGGVARVYITNKGMKVFDTNNIARVEIGELSP